MATMATISVPTRRWLQRLQRLYTWRDCVLSHMTQHRPSWLPIAAPSVRNGILEMCHDVPTAGHLGVRRTLKRIPTRFWWKRCRRDVNNNKLSRFRPANLGKSMGVRGAYVPYTFPLRGVRLNWSAWAIWVIFLALGKKIVTAL